MRFSKPFVQGCAKKLVPGCENSSASLQSAQAGHARLVLNKTLPFLRTTLYMYVDGSGSVGLLVVNQDRCGVDLFFTSGAALSLSLSLYLPPLPLSLTLPGEPATWPSRRALLNLGSATAAADDKIIHHRRRLRPPWLRRQIRALER